VLLSSLSQMNPWTQILSQLESRIGWQNFSTWLKPTTFSHQEDGTVYVRVANATCKDWIAENYMGQIQMVVRELELPVREVLFLCEASNQSPVQEAVPVKAEVMPRTAPLNPRYRFDTFVVGGSNALAEGAAQNVAKNPAGKYNPLFLYGGVGLGKTHLMHAIGNELQRRLPHWRICYISAERFMNEMIQSIKGDSMASFRTWIRNVDALLVDDVQMLANGERTQEEFFHTFNTLYELRKQIVLSSDCPPKTIAIEERLRSRFEWGLIADIQPPELEVRQAILMKKAEEEHFDLPENVALYIAEHVRSNVRMLEGCLVRLIAHCSITGELIREDIAAQVLRSLLAGEHKEVSLEAIQNRVCEKFGVKLGEMKAKNNTKRVVFPRQVAMYMARELTPASLPEIARAFGGKHHTTVLHSVEKIKAKRLADRDFHKELSQLMASFK
jgi:chromosomal replication initiator protein